MNHSSTSVRIAQAAVVTLLVAAPFHAFLTVWGASLVGNYTALRLWSAVLLALLAALGLYWLLRDPLLRREFTGNLIVRLALAFALINGVCAAAGLLVFDVSPLAVLTGLLLNLRYVAFFLFVWAVARYHPTLARNWQKIVLIPAFIVALFAVLQYVVLPDDFLRHFGYGPGTIDPFETINNNLAYQRFSSTLRGPNPLGAYMLVASTATVALWNNPRKRQFMLSATLVLSLCALLISFSRSAWLGTIASVLVVLIVRYHRLLTTTRLTLGGVLLVVVFAGVFIVAEQNRFIQNAVFHTDDSSTIATSSNDARSNALLDGFKDAATHPLGQGVGSAGPASFQNDGRSDISENYFLQIAQETGWLGLGIFIALLVAVGRALWGLRSNPLALTCFASLVGLTIVNMLSHAWADDTLAFVWWGMAGIALAPTAKVDHAKTQ